MGSQKPPYRPATRSGWARQKWAGLFLATVSLVAAQPARAEVQAEIVSIGFPFESGWGYRIGDWIPVVIELALLNQTSFDGLLRLQQPDRDGDFPIDEVEVHLIQANDSPAAPRRYTLYALAYPPRGSNPRLVQVQLLSATDHGQVGNVVEIISQGQRQRTLSLPQLPTTIGADELAILSLGEGTMGKISRLGIGKRSGHYEREVRVAHIAPDALPERWQGLEMIDVVVWDEADPTRINDAQARALVEWTRQGGTLVLAAGRTAATLADTPPFDSLLPVKIESIETVSDLPAALTFLQSFDVPTPKLPPALTIARCQILPDARPVLAETDGDSSIPTMLISSRGLGRGRLIFIAVAVGELLSAECDAVRFWEIVLGLRLRTDRESARPTSQPLFGLLEREIGFAGTTGIYMTAALVFLILYSGGSTVGAWYFLKSRGWTRHSWSAFAATAIVATVVSLAAVQSTRGFGQKLEHITIVDGTVGDRFVRAISYCGLRATVDTTLDIWVPDDYSMMDEPAETQAYIKPLPLVARLDGGEGAFTDPTSYRVRPARALMENVRLRATVKQLEARWFGELPGAVFADIRIQLPPRSMSDEDQDDTAPKSDENESRNRAAIAMGNMELRGTITNGLPFALRDCLLFHAVRDIYTGDFYSGLDRQKRIYAHRIGTLAAGESFDLRDLYQSQDAVGQVTEIPFSDWGKHTLDAAQNQWGRAWASLLGRATPSGTTAFSSATYQDVLLSATTASDARLFKGFAGFGLSRVSRAGLRPLDISDRIDLRTALLVGFADESADHTGPVIICTRSGNGKFKPVKPTKGRTLYRFLIPLSNSSEDGGQPPK